MIKYLSIFIFSSGVIIWSMIGISKLRAQSVVPAAVSVPKTNVTTNQVPVVPQQENSQISVSTVSASVTTAPLPVEVPKDSPKTLIIPKIGLTAGIESVGLDSASRMDVPKNWFNVGWYNLGYPIGGPGTAVIDGHLDTVNGAPAAFYRIGNLEPGDLVTVLGDSGKSYNFRVTSKKAYDFNKLPLESIFATGGVPGLNLITCAGSWDKGSHNYLQRLVVYTRME